MADGILGLIGLAAAVLTVIGAAESGRAKAWGWLASIVMLWPVGVLAWFIAGRRFYDGEA